MAAPAPVVQPTLSVKDVSGNPSASIPLSIQAEPAAAALTVSIIGLPDGATLSKGRTTGPGTWQVASTEVAGLTLTLPAGTGGDLTLQVIANDGTNPPVQKPLTVKVVPPDFTPGTTRQKVWVFCFLLAAAFLMLWIWFWRVGDVQTVANNETQVAYAKPDELVVKSGPPSFRYDAKKLYYRGLMDAQQKEELVKLVDSQAKSTADAAAAAKYQASVASYQAAIDELAYDSNKDHPNFILKIFLLGGISGILGVLMRSIFNFVRVTCFENKFDWHRWWPWYITRPILGFFLGLVCVLFVEADLFQPGGKAGAGLAWWLGIALLAGFAADDFVEKIRLIGQTLFGDASGKGQAQKSGSS